MYNYFSKIVLGFLFLVQLSSCDLLSTRDAEEPEVGRSSYIIATTPDQLFTNLRNAFAEKVEKDYMSSFVDSSFLKIPYQFIPSSEAAYKYSSLNEWDLDAEETYFRNLITKIGENSNVVLRLELISNSIEGNVENRNYNYTISIPFIDETTSQFYEGNAFFKVILDENNQWVITEWRDTKINENPSWSELKGLFYIF